MKTSISTITGAALKSFAFFAAALTIASCVHEYPDDGKGIDPTRISLTVELTTNPKINASSVFSKSANTAPYVWFVVEIYEEDFGGKPVLRHEASAPKNEDGSASIVFNTSLNAGKYRLAAFATCVEDEQGNGSHYDMTDLGGIVFANEEYTGSTDLKECYDLRMDIDLPNDEWFGEKTLSGTLEPPVGRVEIIAEDAKEFLTKQAELLSKSGIETEEEQMWEGYKARWDYALYFPTKYNAFTGVPTDAQTGIMFLSEMTPLSDNEVLMGYDYVFVNGDRTRVNITLSLVDKETGEILNSYSGLTAEINKGETSVIRGDFLTTSNKSGIGIDTGFEDEINIPLPD